MTNREGEPVERPAPRPRRRAQGPPRAQHSVIYIAGVVYTPPGEKSTAAAAFSLDGEVHERMGKCIPATSEQLLYVAEFFAALAALRSVNENTALTIYSAQPYVREAMNKKLRRWEHEGWVGVQHRNILRCVAAELKARKAPTYFRMAEPGTTARTASRQLQCGTYFRMAEPGTTARTACKRVTRFAKHAARSSPAAVWDLTIPPNTALPGLSLQGNRQKVFYKSIREEKTKKLAPRVSTELKLETIREAVYEAFGRHVSHADIWNSMGVKDFLPKPAQFLWKSVHNAHKVGSFWTHIPECEDRAICVACGVLEDLDHILVRCESPGRELVWKPSGWKEKMSGPRCRSVPYCQPLGCGLAELKFRDDRRKVDPGARRLYRILMSESAYLIWRLRNERVPLLCLQRRVL
ncbi:hypothetical protein GGX14DRAFT_394564 [Mycena pura]|uniref:RNase H type-1 domain-containing protein n=1 Tax=Mycena pura TaxID=153505 RepID=A0AAD6VFZ3_9AGAR|nr:hypothetical protein GGX14DRAFT_394564 [Mycena pura]